MKNQSLNKEKKTNELDDILSRGIHLVGSRTKIVISLFCIIAIIVFVRLFWLQIINSDASRIAAEESRTITYTQMPKRGTIYDRNGNILAVSKEATTVYANPSEIENDSEVANKLCQFLGGEYSDYIELISDKEKKFSYIKRRIDNDLANSLREQNVSGVYFLEDSKRVYPYGKTAGQVVGCCNSDGDGLSGIELFYDDVLRGATGKTTTQQGRSGMPIPGGKIQETNSIDGQDLLLTIDIELQQKAEEILISAKDKLSAKSTHTVVVDPATGEIYACASLPLLDPNDILNIEDGATDLRAVSATFEPGSTFKTVAANSVLEYEVMTPEEQVFCPAKLQADEYYVSDSVPRGDTIYTFREILAKSSNVGISLCTEKLGFDKFYNKILKYNLDKQTGVDYPGNISGYLPDYKDWSTIQSYNISFGQGVTVTPLQLTRFYAALANNGVETTPHFLMRYLQTDEDIVYPVEDVIDNKNALPNIHSMLRSVVSEDGTAKECQIDGYGVAGKTGTGEIADKNGKYLSGVYYISFVGFLSTASQPLTCFVGAENVPSEQHINFAYKELMDFAIERFKIAPMT